MFITIYEIVKSFVSRTDFISNMIDIFCTKENILRYYYKL